MGIEDRYRKAPFVNNFAYLLYDFQESMDLERTKAISVSPERARKANAD